MLSILITHYNRPEALKKCINTLRDFNFNINYEIVVSDDGSNIENIEKLKDFQIDTLVTTKVNQGLAANINKGLKACIGANILYVQEDFLIDSKFNEVFLEGLVLLEKGILDMVRYRANYVFSKLIKCSDNIFRIPKFSFSNFNINTFQYSDHPFLTTKTFYETYGYYLENTSVGYGETEFAIRIMKSTAKIGITKINYFHAIDVESTLGQGLYINKSKIRKKIKRFARALRQHFEWVLYNPNKRKLYTYKNRRLLDNATKGNL